jgi:hypothetical protein
MVQFEIKGHFEGKMNSIAVRFAALHFGVNPMARSTSFDKDGDVFFTMAVLEKVPSF